MPILMVGVLQKRPTIFAPILTLIGLIALHRDLGSTDLPVVVGKLPNTAGWQPALPGNDRR